MTLNSHADLAAAEIAFYAPALCLSLFVCYRQGFSKNLGWFYLVLISILRIIGASCTLYIVTQKNLSPGLLETVAITSAIGLAPLLLVLLGFLERIHQRMGTKGLPLYVFRPIHLVSLVTLILGIVGGVDKSEADTQQTGTTLIKVASILFLVIYLSLAAISILTATRKSHVQYAEHTLSLISIIVLPFVLVRVIYTVTVSFGTSGSIFNAVSPNVWIQAFMMFCMEAICVTLYVCAGILTPKQTALETHSSKSIDHESGSHAPVEGRQARKQGRK